MITNADQHKLIYEFSGSRQLVTNPIDVTGLDGDSWDYFIETSKPSGAGYNRTTSLLLNNDSGTNYRAYRMRGYSTTAQALVSEVDNQVSLGYTDNVSEPSYNRTLITGESGSERYISLMTADGESGFDTVIKSSYYWKNAADNLTSMRITATDDTNWPIDIRIYQVPKQANLQNYDLVEVVDFVNRSTDIVFSGLDGDSDGEYLVFLDQNGGSSRPKIAINNDKTSAYTYQGLRNTGSISAGNASSTGIEIMENSESQRCISTTRILTKSGIKRIGISSGSCALGTFRQSEPVTWYDNVVDNIASLNIFDLSNSTGTVKLYKRKSNRTIDPVPMMTVVEHDINGVDFSNGITISGIEGDRIDGAIKVEFVGEGAGGNNTLLMRVNGDTGSNYQRQFLRSIGSAAAAGTTSETRINMTENIDDTSSCELWLYPQSGQNRPILLAKNGVYTSSEFKYFDAYWWNNTTDQITSIDIYNAFTVATTGKIRISVPVGTKQAIGSWQIVVN